MANLTFDVATRGDDRAAAAFGRVSQAMDRTGTAVRRLEDQQNRAKAASIAGEKAALDLAEAQKHLAKVTADSSATDETRRRAALRVQDAQLRQTKAAQSLERANTPLAASGRQVTESMDRTEGASRRSSRAMGVLSASAHGVRSSFRVMGVGMVGALAVVGVGVGLVLSQMRGWIAEAREAAAAGKQTASVIKATGGAAHVTAQQVGDLAGAISNKVGVDDEAIQAGENLLLTFKGVRNETGKGNDIFNQATATIVDMTAAMNNGKVTSEGLKASTIQVGKALNDPIKGITALTKVGVTFTDQQKKQIISLTQHGHALEAQKIILGELSSEFGGFAAASADPMQKLGVVFGNIKETIGTALLPYVNRLSTWLGERAPAVAATAVKAIGGIAQGVGTLVHGFQSGTATGKGFLGFMSRVGAVSAGAWSWITGTAIPALSRLAGWVNRNKATFGQFGAATLAVLLRVGGNFLIMAGYAVKGVGYIIGYWQKMTHVILDGYSLILHGAATAFGWMPGIGGKIKTARDGFDRFSRGVDTAMKTAAVAAGKTGDALIVLGHRTVDASDKAVALRKRMSELRSRQLVIDAIDRAKPVADRIARAIGAIHSRTVQVTVTQGGTIQRVQREINSIHGKNVVVGVQIGSVRGVSLAMNARGTRDWGGGWSVVGEEGPELVNVPKGSDIYSTQESRGMLRPRAASAWTAAAGTGGGDTHVHLYFGQPVGDPKALGREVEKALTNLKRSQAGKLSFQ